MTKHRKMLEGVSEEPLNYDEGLSGAVGYACDKDNFALAEFDNNADAKLFVHARNHWESICDLIDAVQKAKTLKYKLDRFREFSLAVDEIFAALDKLNEES